MPPTLPYSLPAFVYAGRDTTGCYTAFSFTVTVLPFAVAVEPRLHAVTRCTAVTVPPAYTISPPFVRCLLTRLPDYCVCVLLFDVTILFFPRLVHRTVGFLRLPLLPLPLPPFYAFTYVTTCYGAFCALCYGCTSYLHLIRLFTITVSYLLDSVPFVLLVRWFSRLFDYAHLRHALTLR